MGGGAPNCTRPHGDIDPRRFNSFVIFGLRLDFSIVGLEASYLIRCCRSILSPPVFRLQQVVCSVLMTDDSYSQPHIGFEGRFCNQAGVKLRSETKIWALGTLVRLVRNCNTVVFIV